MSYCRWSSDDSKSDVYVYESVNGGFDVHVAGNKVNFDRSKLPPMPNIKDSDFGEKYIERIKIISSLLEDAEIEPLNSKHAGKSYNFESPGETALALEDMKQDGLHVPDGVIEELLKEDKG